MNLKNLLNVLFVFVFGVLMSMQVLATEEVANDQVYLLGNCKSSGMDNAAIFGFGDGELHTFGGASLLTLESLQAKGDRILGIRVFIGEEIKTGKVILGADYEKPELEKEFTYKKGGWQYVLFDQPYTFTADTYIGFVATGTTDFLALEQVSKNSPTEAINIEGSWDLVKNQLGKYVWAIQAIVAGGDYSAEVQNNVVLERASASKSAKEGETFVVSCELRNSGVVPAQNVSVECTVGDVTKVIAVTDKLMNGQSLLLEFNDFVAPEVEGNSATVAISLAAVYELDSISTDNVSNANLTIYTKDAVERNAVLIEQFTGQACPNCPPGAKALAAAIAGMEDPSKAVWVAHHTYYTDDFSLSESATIANVLAANFAPACNIDRMPVEYMPGTTELIWHPGYATTSLLEDLLEIPSLASLNLNADYDAESRVLNVAVNGKSLVDAAYVTVIVKQNGILAQQSGVSGKYEHNNAPRLFLTAAKGDKLTLDAEGNYTASFEAEIPEYVGKFGCKGKLEVVAFVHGDISKSDKRTVHNTAQASIDVVSDVEDAYTTDLAIYPNPTVDVLYVDGVNAGDVVKVYTIDGILVKEQQFGAADASINVAGLNAGTYFLQLNEKVVKFIKK